MGEIVKLRRPGYFSLADLPQRGSIAKQAFGTGWEDLDAILKFYLGQFIVLTGIPGHGKSTFLLNVLTMLAREQGIKSFLYVPENENYLREKMRALWQGPDESFDYFAANQCFVQSAVPEERNEPPHTIEWVLDKAAEAVRSDSVEMVWIDPWNELERSKPRDMLLTDYIGQCLMLVKDFCRTLDVIVGIVAHPTKPGSDKSRGVTLYDIESSAHWFNKCDNGLIVIRDNDKNSCRVMSAKVREIGAGKLGACCFAVDPQTGIFKPFKGSQVDVPF